MYEAKHYAKLPNNAVECTLCPNNCHLEAGKTSGCLSRRNIAGVLYAINYARTISVNLDPIEKKPLYHYYPGSNILSVGANSCNLHCDFCQNYSISQHENSTTELSPDKLLSVLKREKLQQVAFTYTEPFTWYEYIMDFARLAADDNIRIVLVTNGYINREPLDELLPWIDALNIDLKGMSEAFYRKICCGKLAPVLETIRTAYHQCHIEITNLVIPGLNDSEAMINDLVDFVAGIDSNIPLHFSRYFPNFKSDRPVTPVETIMSACNIARHKLAYVYPGNVNIPERLNTICPKCDALLIQRSGYTTTVKQLIPACEGNTGHCAICHTTVYGKF